MYLKNMSWKPYIFGALIGCVLLITYFELRVMQNEDSKKSLETIITQLKDRIVSQETYKVPAILNSENIVVIYNRVPKTGSTSFINVAYELCKRNHFRVLHINVTGNLHVLSMTNQVKFVQNVSEWDYMKPALYHGHMAYVDFQRFGVVKLPLYINIIRKPLDRLVSYYYFLRYGDNFRPYLVRRKHGDRVTFDECVQQGLPGCDPDNMWLQVPFFCGHAVECWHPGSLWALEEAKRNLLRHYLVVGVTEEMEDFVKVLELMLPRMFKGATKYYLTNSNKTHLRVTYNKQAPSEVTVAKVQKSAVWKVEQDFYDFALQQFKFSIRRMNLVNSQATTDNEQIFFYEKIRPK